MAESLCVYLHMLFTCTGLENITPAPDSCSSLPCQHSGSCDQTGDGTGYSCLCVQGSTGDNCQTGKKINRLVFLP